MIIILSGLLLALVVGFVIGLVLCIKKRSKWAFLFGTGIILAVISIISIFRYNPQSSIWVLGASDESMFTYEVQNNLISRDGKQYIFDIEKGKDTFFNQIKNDFDTTFEEDNSICIFQNNQCYRIDYMKKNLFSYRYKMYADYLTYYGSHLYKIPFPVSKIKVTKRVGSDYEITCDLDYLKRYYKSFTNVTVEGNIIRITQKQDITRVYILKLEGNKINIEIEKS